MIALLIFSVTSTAVMKSSIHSLRLATDNRYRLIAIQLLVNYKAWKIFTGDATPPVAWIEKLELLPAVSYQITQDSTLETHVHLCWQVYEKQQCLSDTCS